MSIVTNLLENAVVYSTWQAPFVAQKLVPVLAHNDLRTVRRVLDVGCGPGTNTSLFAEADYVGVDINPGYISYAQKKHGREFVAADVTSYEVGAGQSFDFILVNSLFHHINDTDCHKILARLRACLMPYGYIHILELLSPGDHSIAQRLADWDRGKYVRSLVAWRRLFEEHLDIVVLEPYSLKLLGTTLWKMVYCKGRAKS